jgi:hypothetical protein
MVPTGTPNLPSITRRIRYRPEISTVAAKVMDVRKVGADRESLFAARNRSLAGILAVASAAGSGNEG